MIISDVTVTYNNLNGLQKTVKSLINSKPSKGDKLQITVIDGNSDDGSKEFLAKTKDSLKGSEIEFDYLSEPDNGIYNAMNKGIDVADGEWVFFLNAGDVLIEDFSFDAFFEMAKEEHVIDRDFIYGDSLRDYGDGKILAKPLNIDTIKRGLPFSHQSVFCRTEHFKKRKYDESFRISGDYEWFLNAYLEGKTFGYIPMCVSCFDTNGISATHLYENYLEAMRIRDMHGCEDSMIVREIKRFVWRVLDLIGCKSNVVETLNEKIANR